MTIQSVIDALAPFGGGFAVLFGAAIASFLISRVIGWFFAAFREY